MSNKIQCALGLILILSCKPKPNSDATSDFLFDGIPVAQGGDGLTESIGHSSSVDGIRYSFYLLKDTFKKKIIRAVFWISENPDKMPGAESRTRYPHVLESIQGVDRSGVKDGVYIIKNGRVFKIEKNASDKIITSFLNGYEDGSWPNSELFKDLFINIKHTNIPFAKAENLAAPETEEPSWCIKCRKKNISSEEMLKKYDKDKDGKLNNEELLPLQVEAKNNLWKLMHEFDKDKDGILSDEEAEHFDVIKKAHESRKHQ